VRTRLYRNGRLVREGFPDAEIAAYVADEANVVWADLCAPGHAELSALGEELGLHELAVEDVVADRQRPKVDVYDNHLFLTVYAAAFEEDRFAPVEIAAFVTRNALVTVRPDDRFDMREVARRWDASAHLAGHGAAFLLHGLLDCVVDGHLELAQDLDGRAEDMEEMLFEERPVDGRRLQRAMYDLRKTTVGFRKIALPMREIVGTLLRRDQAIISGSRMAPYFEDVYDHALRTAELVEALREMLANIRETRLAQQGFRLNEIMKHLTSWAAIIAVPTAVTGFYGQNVLYPGVGTLWGFWVSVVLMAFASIALYAVFKRKNWL